MTDTPNRSPLWRALKVADASWISDLNTIPEARAIIAVRNWLKMELPEGGARSESDAGGPAMSERPGLNELMRSMPPQWRYRWCESALCGCLGCANGSGKLSFYGYTREEHNEWIKSNPKETQL